MIFVFHLLDRSEARELRQQVRPAHKEYLAQVADRIAFAGPLLAEDGVAMCGSLLAIDFPSLADAKDWLKDEPFTRAGLYATCSVNQFSNLWPQKVGFPP